MTDGYLIAHGVGGVYQSPIPLSFYLLGAALTVIASLALRAAAGARRVQARERRLLGARASAATIAIFRVAGLVALMSMVVFGVLYPERGFTVAPLIFWVVLIISTTLVSSALAGLWPRANPWTTLEGLYRLDEPAQGGSSPPWWLGPLLVYGLFWFELVSGLGFDPIAILIVLLLYSFYVLTFRTSFGAQWALADPLSILFGFASRLAPLEVRESGIFYRGVIRGLAEESLMPLALFASVFVLMASTTLDNVRETVEWSSFLNATGLVGVSPRLLDSLALAAFTLPFFVPFLGAVAIARRFCANYLSLWETARRFGWSLIPIGIAYVLAHNLPLLMIGVPQLLEQIIDAVVADPFKSYSPSPQLVWFVEIALIVGGHILGVLSAHHQAVRLSGSHSAAVKGHTALTILMSIFTVVTLWLLSLPLVKGR